MMEENLPIQKQFAYRPKAHFILLGFLFFVPCSIWMLWMANTNVCSPDMSTGDCSMGSYQASVAARIFFHVIGLGVLGIPFMGLYKRMKSEKDPKNSRVAFTEKYILGPSQGFWSNKEAKVYYTDIKDFYIDSNQHKHLILKVISDNVDLTIMDQLLEGDDLKNIYEELKFRIEKPELANKEAIEEIHTYQEKKKINKAMPYIAATIVYMILCFAPAIAFNSYWNNQIEDGGLFGIGLIINLILLGVILFVLRFFKKPELLSQLIGGYVLIALGFFVGFGGQVSLLSFLNQLGDNSQVQERVTYLVVDDAQSKESVRRDGICYKFKNFDDPEANFRKEDICEGKYLEISSGKEVLVRYREGNFGHKWFVDYTFKN